MLWEVFLIGLIIGWLRKGRIKNLSRLSLKGWPLILLAVLIQAAIMIDYAASLNFLVVFYPLLYITSFILLIIFFFLQGKQTGFIIIGFGIFLNLLVIGANGGAMPVDITQTPSDIAEQPADGINSPFHTHITDDTKLEFLGDRISIPYRTNHLLSVGDIIMAFGVAFLIQQKMHKKRKRGRYR